MSDPLKMRQVCALVDELIETAQGSAQEEIEELEQQLAEAQMFESLWAGVCEVVKNDSVQTIYRLREQVKGLEASLDLAKHERNNLLETVAKQDAEIAALKQTCIDHVEIQNALREQVTLLREALRFMHDEKCNYMRLNKLGDPLQETSARLALKAFAATEH